MSLYDRWDVPKPGWVCAECGFDYDATALDGVADELRSFGRRYRAPLTRALKGEDLDALLRTRPQAGVWSALEYACHTRDALRIYDHRINKALTADRPVVPQMNRDQAVEEFRYNEQSPATVADELAGAAEALAERVEGVPDDGWERAVVREGEDLTVAWMARNAVHEGSHHLLDIGRILRGLRQA
jgi:hypothetical protein